MIELSLNILDIVQNSIRAEADRIEICLTESVKTDRLELKIKDNGKGIPENILSTVEDPFTTTRTTRKTGFGLPLLKHHALITGGDIKIVSTEGSGTEVTAWFGLSHIDRQPLGDITGVLIILISSNPDIDFIYTHKTDTGQYSFSTLEAKMILETERLDNYLLLKDIGEIISENLSALSVSA
ncbi:MAG TPA: ATP-binding protein [Bacteroidales bacterium]|nr:ATP-binding protein [Bacteroidales bacterium]